jgi:hypothetical protein
MVCIELPGQVAAAAAAAHTRMHPHVHTHTRTHAHARMHTPRAYATIGRPPIESPGLKRVMRENGSPCGVRACVRAGVSVPHAILLFAVRLPHGYAGGYRGCSSGTVAAQGLCGCVLCASTDRAHTRTRSRMHARTPSPCLYRSSASRTPASTRAAMGATPRNNNAGKTPNETR